MNVKLPKPLFSYQHHDIKRAVSILRSSPTQSVILGHEMGLGKTVMALLIQKRLSQARGRRLILCPASVRGVWRDQILTWLAESIPEGTIWIPKNGAELNSPRSFLFLILSYDLAIRPNVAKRLVKQHWYMMICDEAHHLSSQKSKRTKLVLGNLFSRADYKMFLTGSVMRNKVINLWPMFRAIAPHKIGSRMDFAREYCYLKRTRYGLQAFGGKNLDKLQKLSKDFLIRRKKKDVLKDLPDKLEQKVPILDIADLPENPNITEDELTKMIEDEIMDHELATYRQLLGLCKVEAIAEFSKELTGPLVIFVYHHQVCSRLLRLLEKKKKKVAVMTGASSSSSRDKAVKDFQTGKADIFLGTYAAAEGITLTRASTVAVGEMSWSLAQNEQAIDRLHRIGQKATVQVYYLVVENTLDEVVYNVYKQKSYLKRKVIDG